MKKVILLVLLSYLPSYLQGLKIFDRIDAAAEGFHDNNKDIKSTPQRATPEYSRQPVRTGLSYNDADDVIHIIEPPQHFQDMKRRHRQHHGAQMTASNFHMQQHRPSFARKPLPKVTSTKVKDHAAVTATAKVEKPEMPERHGHWSNRRKPTADTIKRDLSGIDLQTQETRVHNENHLAPKGKFPLEILASVRQTERLIQKKHQQHQQHQQLQRQRPFAKQRVKLHKTQTVISERGYEQANFKHGNENRAGGFKATSGGPKRLQRMRRAAENASNAPLSSDIQRAHQVTNHNIEQGSMLLARLDALIKHATWYLPDDNYTATHNHVLEELRMRFQNEFGPKQLIGEIEPTPIVTISPEQELYQILESSLNATETIMQEIMRKRADSNATHLEKLCDEAFEPSESPLQHLQSKLDCMRLQLSLVREQAKPTTTTTTTSSPTRVSVPSHRGNIRYGERTRLKTSSGPKTSTSSTLLLRDRYKKNRGTTRSATLRIDNFLEDTKIKAPLKAGSSSRLFDTYNVSAAAAVLLYDDVMTNIRNMLEAKNLKLSHLVPEVHKPNDHTDEEDVIAIDFIDASASTAKSPSTSIDSGVGEDPSHVRDLSRYLSDLHHIVSHLPQIKRSHSSTDTASGKSNSHTGSKSDWYLINEEGKISDTPFEVQLQPSVVIFHRFPDIPNAAVYVSNHTTPESVSESSTPENTYNFF